MSCVNAPSHYELIKAFTVGLLTAAQGLAHLTVQKKGTRIWYSECK